MKLQWTTVQRRICDLVPLDYNPRYITEERKQKLLASLEKFNLVEIPAINFNNDLLAGHQRIKVMLEIGRGQEIIDVRYPNRLLTEQEVKEYNITSNVSAGFWDTDLLDQAFADIDLKGLGLDVLKIEVPDIVPDRKIEAEQDFIVIPPKNPVTVLGDVIELLSVDKKLEHKIVCGSSTDHDHCSSLFGASLSDLIITDPPYNVDYTGGTSDALKIQNDKMSDDEFRTFLHQFYSNAYAFSKPGTPVYVFHADTEGVNFRQQMREAGFYLSQCLVWLKNTIVLGRQDYHWQHEPILYGWKPGSAHPWFSDRSQRSVVPFDKPVRNDDHPTMKPVGLIEYFINNSSKRYQIVGDYFLGSGSSLIASEKTKRHCYGLELDPIYVDVIIRRWHTYMVDNGLDFIIKRNGCELQQKEIQEYYSRISK